MPLDSENRLGDLRGASVASIMYWLEERSAEVGQKTLDRDRQATQFPLHQTSGAEISDFSESNSLNKGGRGFANQLRAYTREQVDLICSRLSDRSALSVSLAYASRLRAHELLTLTPRDPSIHTANTANDRRTGGREGNVYTVKGKGGLVREVLIPFQLVWELESRRLTQPKAVTDRGIRYTSQYDISAGMYFPGFSLKPVKRRFDGQRERMDCDTLTFTTD